MSDTSIPPTRPGLEPLYTALLNNFYAASQRRDSIESRIDLLVFVLGERRYRRAYSRLRPLDRLHRLELQFLRRYLKLTLPA